MIRFLGSAYFALILIALSALAVITGTLLESRSASHGVAEAWIYRHPLFQLLLVGYFINILLSALLRWPFQKRHIPFLITHLGLLMVISGVFIKSIWGVQGQMLLIEGTVSDQLLLPQQPALLVEQRDKVYSLPIVQGKLSQNTLGVTLLDWQPHAQEKWVAWTEKEIAGLPKETPLLLREGSFAQAMQAAEELSTPFLLVHQAESQTTLLTKDLQGKIFQKTFPKDYLEGWVAYDRGFKGYTLQAEIPLATQEVEQLHENSIKKQLEEHLEAFSPPLELIRRGIGHDFPVITVEYLKAWNKDGNWLFKTLGPSWLDQLPWQTIPQEEVNALYWIAMLWEPDLLKHLRERGWPLLRPLEEIPPQEVPLTWMQQLYQVRGQLPHPPDQIPRDIANGMLSAYLRLYNIHYQEIPQTYFTTLESRLHQEINPAPSPEKLEEAKPSILVQLEGEAIPLVYDPKGTGLKWPTASARALLRFQPHRIPLPYSVRLHRAIDLKYPGSEQTQSYECLLSFQNKATGLITPCHVSMNKVYETADGYRFYLAGMGTVDSLGVRSVQLVVNRDPAKYFLTYPGGILLALGIVLLFWFKPYFAT